MVGLAGEGQNFDGNGMYVRFQPGGGDQTISSGSVGPYTTGRCSPMRSRRRSAHAPAYPASARRTSPTTPCYKQQIPDVNGAPTGPPDGGTTPPATDTSAPLLAPINPFATGGK